MCKIELSRCCCFDLKTGTLIIGIVELVFGILGLIGGGSVLFGGHPSQRLEAGISTVFLILGIIASVLLILGVRKDNPRYLFLWIVLKVVSLVFLAITMVLILIKLISASEAELGHGGRANLFTTEISYLIGFAVSFYFLSVVWSYRDQLKGTSNIV